MKQPKIFRSGKTLVFPVWLIVVDLLVVVPLLTWCAGGGLIWILVGFIFGVQLGATGALRGGLKDNKQVWGLYDAGDLVNVYRFEHQATAARTARIEKEIADYGDVFKVGAEQAMTVERIPVNQ